MANVFATFVGGPVDGEEMVVNLRDGQVPETLHFSDYSPILLVDIRPNPEQATVQWNKVTYLLTDLADDHAVYRRSRRRCERCGGAGHEVHHRCARGMGGSKHLDVVENLVRLCWRCHRWATLQPALANERGWVLPHTGRGFDASTARLALLNAVWATLTTTGSYRVGRLELGDINDVHDLLAAVRVQRVVPADPFGSGQATVPAPGVVEKGSLGDVPEGLGHPVGASQVPARAFEHRGEDVAEFASRLLNRR
jgi:hypothetical protein